MAERTCTRCGGLIPARRRDAIYCGKACKKKAEKRRAALRLGTSGPRTYERLCRVCDQTFTAQATNAAYCGRSCQRRAERMRWKERNPHEHARRQRAKQQRAAARARQLKADAYRQSLVTDPCAYCGQPGGTLDHIDAKDRGGTDENDNLTGACHDCNSRKWTTPLLRFLLIQRIDTELQPLEQQRALALHA